MSGTRKVRYGVQLDSLRGNPRSSGSPRLGLRRRLGDEACRRVAAAGLDVIQATTLTGVDMAACQRAGLIPTTSGTWGVVPGDERLQQRLQGWSDAGYNEATLIIGSSVDDRDERRRRVEELLATSSRVGLAVHLETHRSSITQDIDSTCELAGEYPELTFNLDYSHWFFSHGLWDYSVAEIVDRLAPVLRSTEFMHLRVSSPHEMQIRTTDGPWRQHFLDIWTETKRISGTPEITVVTELLPRFVGYATTVCDRWSDSLELITFLRSREVPL